MSHFATSVDIASSQFRGYVQASTRPMTYTMAHLIGQKIVANFPDENDPPPAIALPQPKSGLSVRSPKASSLRIITTNETNDTQLLTVPIDNAIGHNSAGARSAITLDSTLTFGIPDPTTRGQRKVSVTSTLSNSSSANSAQSRRQLRYSREVESLKSSLESCSTEPSPRELQIRALQKATSLLSAHAAEAQERAAKLRATLADRALDPGEYRTLQTERWMEERRSQVRSEQAKALQTVAQHLAASPDSDNPDMATIRKREVNLQRFFQHSPTRITFGMCKTPTAAQADCLFRRQTISDVRSLQLPAKGAAVTFGLKSTARFRSRSLDGNRTISAKRTAEMRQTRGTTTHVPSETPDSRQEASSTTMAVGVKKPMDKRVVKDSDGVATIFKSDVPRTLAEMTTELGEVGMPEYAKSLLDELDNIDGEVSLPQMTIPDHFSICDSGTKAAPSLPPFRLEERFFTHDDDLPSIHSVLGDATEESHYHTASIPHSPLRRPSDFADPQAMRSFETGSALSSRLRLNFDMEGGSRPQTPQSNLGSPRPNKRPTRWSIQSASYPSRKIFAKLKSRFSMNTVQK
ncbi:hypothetical protein K474DRAFT_1708353 [Panus rudis PR-1116 ss-1]|nr:hypothetical protein K474DRAFT_1708353 [Panus rudis PR-1116 ss-1]